MIFISEIIWHLKYTFKQTTKPILNLKPSKLASLFLIIFEDSTVEVWDIEKFKRARSFQLEAAINDAFFSADNKFVFVAS